MFISDNLESHVLLCGVCGVFGIVLLCLLCMLLINDALCNGHYVMCHPP